MNEIFRDVMAVKRYDDEVRMTKVVNSYPFTDIYENDKEELILEMALAGYSKEDINVEIENNIVIISGKRKEKENRKKIFLNGIKNSDFEKSFAIGDEYIHNPIVSYNEGILSLVFRKDDDKKRKKLEIK
jgi:HSP20 family molecular chaperone IbpA